jgi:hypothetical protein
MERYLAADESWSITQVEATDINDYYDDIDDYMDDPSTGLVKWIEDAIATREAGGTPGAPPAMPRDLDLVGQLGLANMLAQLKVKAEFNMFRFGGSTNGGGANDEAVAQKLDDIFMDNSGASPVSRLEYLFPPVIKVVLNGWKQIESVSLDGI